MTKTPETTDLKPWIAAVRMPSGHVVTLPFATKGIAEAYVADLKKQNPDRQFSAEIVRTTP